MTGDRRPTASPVAAQPELEATIIGLVRERLHIEIPGPEAELLESGLIDSLAFVELLMIISEAYGVEVDVADLDMENFRTVRHIGRFIVERQAAPPAAAV